MPNPLSAPQDIDLDPEPAAVQDIELAVPEREPALPFRSDTILGVCEALGQDFGFNPTYLRIALASLVLWNSFAAIGIYLVLGVGVAVSRWIYPRPEAVRQPAAQLDSPVAENANSESLALAA